MANQTCENCAAFQRVGYGSTGACRRKSPVAMQVGPSIQYAGGSMPPTINGVWPPTQENQWCLEWVTKEKPLDDLLKSSTKFYGSYKNPTAHKRRKRRKRKAAK